ncbi:MAG: hypothetical protein R2748_05780 [Bryobacterales bacterium]
MMISRGVAVTSMSLALRPGTAARTWISFSSSVISLAGISSNLALGAEPVVEGIAIAAPALLEQIEGPLLQLVEELPGVVKHRPD